MLDHAVVQVKATLVFITVSKKRCLESFKCILGQKDHQNSCVQATSVLIFQCVHFIS
jgi:hypothetical protein